MEDKDIPAALPTSSPKEPEDGGDVGGEPQPDTVVLQPGLQPTAARGDRDGPCGARDGPAGTREGPCEARDGPCGAREGPCGAREGPCGAHVSTEIRVLKAGRDFGVVVGSRTGLCHSEERRRCCGLDWLVLVTEPPHMLLR